MNIYREHNIISETSSGHFTIMGFLFLFFSLYQGRLSIQQPHLCMSPASFSKSIQLFLMAFIFFIMFLLQDTLGNPLFLFPMDSDLVMLLWCNYLIWFISQLIWPICLHFLYPVSWSLSSDLIRTISSPFEP